MNFFRRAAVIVLGLLVSSPALTKDVILCRNMSNPEKNAVISLSSHRLFGRMLNCISGGGFFYEMIGCAPVGAYGLSGDEKSGSFGELVKVADHEANFAAHVGGVAGHWMNENTIRFEGGFVNNGGPSPYKREWIFLVNRLTGGALLNESYSHNTTIFQCAKSKP